MHKTDLMGALPDPSIYLPNLSVDCVVFGFHDNLLRVLLLRLKNTEVWALPGGWIQYQEPVAAAAARVLAERTGLTEVYLRQFHTFGDPDRLDGSDVRAILARQNLDIPADFPLFQRTVSVGYYALVEFAQVTPIPDALSDACTWWDIQEVPALFFDHNRIIETAIQTLRQQLSYLPVGLNLLPEHFTMPELQRLYETILGYTLDRRNFQKRMLAYDFLIRHPQRRTGGAYKSPFLYSFDAAKYHAALESGRFSL